MLGVLFYEWFLLCLSLAVTLIGLPYVRRNFNKGMAFHYPYRRFKMHLPGLVNPGGAQAYPLVKAPAQRVQAQFAKEEAGAIVLNDAGR